MNHSKETVLKTVAELFDLVKEKQSKVDELQKKLDEYIFVAESIDEMYVKEVQKNNDLQKRLDELELAIKGAVTFVGLQITATEQGRESAIGTQNKNWWSSKLLMLRPVRRVLEQALKGEQP